MESPGARSLRTVHAAVRIRKRATAKTGINAVPLPGSRAGGKTALRPKGSINGPYEGPGAADAA